MAALSNNYQRLTSRGFLTLREGNPVENLLNCGKKPFLNIFKRFISFDLMLVFVVILASSLPRKRINHKWG